MARSARKRTILGDLPKRFEKAQTRAEKAINRTWKAALDLLPATPRKTVKSFGTRVEKAAKGFDRRRRQALKRVDSRRKNLVSDLEKRATGAVKPLVDRLDVASRRDVERLNRRIAQLERRVARQTTTKHAAAA